MNEEQTKEIVDRINEPYTKRALMKRVFLYVFAPLMLLWVPFACAAGGRLPNSSATTTANVAATSVWP